MWSFLTANSLIDSTTSRVLLKYGIAAGCDTVYALYAVYSVCTLYSVYTVHTLLSGYSAVLSEDTSVLHTFSSCLAVTVSEGVAGFKFVGCGWV